MARYTISKKPLTPNTIWDAGKGAVLCSFANGKIETDDGGLAKALEALGHTVTADADGVGGGEPGADADGGTGETATKGRRSRK